MTVRVFESPACRNLPKGGAIRKGGAASAEEIAAGKPSGRYFPQLLSRAEVGGRCHRRRSRGDGREWGRCLGFGLTRDREVRWIRQNRQTAAFAEITDLSPLYTQGIY